MFKHNDFKESRQINAEYVECPIVGCSNTVQRAKRGETLQQEQFYCPQHKIYISPSTIVYADKQDNILWQDNEDVNLLKSIEKVKRECRMEHENSEDAVTWNVFRYLDKNNLLESLLEKITNEKFDNADLMYWSYSCKEGNTWSFLQSARKEFGEEPERSSEPDLIVDSHQTLFFIEAKFTSSNKTTPSDPGKLHKYAEGGNRLFDRVCSSSIENIAVVEKKYQLLRNWLIGSWIAEKMQKRFCFVNLVLSDAEKDIETGFGKYLRQDQFRCFKRFTWEEIHDLICEQQRKSDTETMLDYFRTKTAGYNSDNGKCNDVPFRLS